MDGMVTDSARVQRVEAWGQFSLPCVSLFYIKFSGLEEKKDQTF